MTDDAIILRSAGDRDAGVVASHLSDLGYPTEPSVIPQRLQAIRREGGEILLASDSAGAELGLMSVARHVVLHGSGPVAYITALVTSEAARRRGVGRKLVEAAKKWAADEGCSRITVTSAEHRADAHAFYPSCGLPYTGRRFGASIA
ncbi:MAG TPA: GNAT family N-acetyltransferase [Gemmatimonadaceae bacterium]|nr:GNAT family N-acetyltransferase [Gemmatimonadaceae bacterium]